MSAPIIVGQRDESAMDAHMSQLLSMRQGHEIQMNVINNAVSEELARGAETDWVHVNLMKIEQAMHCNALTTIAAQFALLHAMNVPGVPEPVVQNFTPEGVTTQ